MADANQESTNEMTSQIIPMIAPEVDLSEIKDDVRTIENILQALDLNLLQFQDST